MALWTTSDAAGPVNNKFQQVLLRNAKARAPYRLGSTPAMISENEGTFTAKWRRIENLSVSTTALSELTGSLSFPTRTPTTATVTDLTATLSKYGNFVFLNEEVDLINFSGQTAKLVEVLGINAGQTLNRLQRDEVEDNSTAVYAGTATADSTVSSAIALNDIRGAVSALLNNSALKFTPMTFGDRNIGTSAQRDAFWGITHVDATFDLRDLTGWVAAENYGNQVQLAKGEIGSIGGVRWIETEEASADSGGAGTATATGIVGTDLISTTANTNDLYTSVIFGMDAHGSVGLGFQHIKETYQAGDPLPGVQAIAHNRGSAGVADPLSEVSSLGYKTWNASKILNTAWIRSIHHGATLY